MACGLAAVYLTQRDLQTQAARVAQASARAQAAQQAGQRLMRMALDLRAALAGSTPSEPALQRHRASLQWQYGRLVDLFNDMAGPPVGAHGHALDKALDKARASAAGLAPLYQAALARGRQGWAAAPDGALLAAEPEALRQVEDLQTLLARTLAVEQGRLQEAAGQSGGVAVFILMMGAVMLVGAWLLSWVAVRRVQEAHSLLQHKQTQAASASANLLLEAQAQLASGRDALAQSLQATQALSGHAERLLRPVRPPPARRTNDRVRTDPSPLALAAQVIARAKRAAG